MCVCVYIWVNDGYVWLRLTIEVTILSHFCRLSRGARRRVEVESAIYWNRNCVIGSSSPPPPSLMVVLARASNRSRNLEIFRQLGISRFSRLTMARLRYPRCYARESFWYASESKSAAKQSYCDRAISAFLCCCLHHWLAAVSDLRHYISRFCGRFFSVLSLMIP